MTKFETGKNIYTVALLWGTVIFMLILMFFIPDDEDAPLMFYLIMGATTLFLLWILLDTGYTIGNGFLHYRSGPFRGKIRISSIRKIQYDDSIIKASVIKPGLARKGFLITYSGYEDIFVSPKNREAFLDTLRKENSAIQVIGGKKPEDNSR